MSQGLQIFGHRGSRGTHSENTFPSFDEALEAGADGIELDIQMTADEVPIVFHDPFFSNRLCCYEDGKPLKERIVIGKTQSERLSDFRIGAGRDPRYPKQKMDPEAKIPTLREFLEWAVSKAPKLTLNIELKNDAPEECRPSVKKYATKVFELIEEFGVWERSIVHSFDRELIVKANEMKKGGPFAVIYPLQKNFADLAAKDPFPMVTVDFRAANKKTVSILNEANVRLLCYTPNTQKEWKRLAGLNVNVIITDYPRDLRKFLKDL